VSATTTIWGARVHLFPLGSDGVRAQARARVLELLARELGCRPADVPLAHAANGRPGLAHGALRLSISHTRGLGALATHGRRAVGVDVEPLAPLPELPALTELALSEREAEWVLAPGAAQGAHRFLTLWTLKEAVVKAAGTGLDDPRAVDVLDGAGQAARCRYAGAEWRMTPLAAPAGFVAALAVAASPETTMARGDDT
jgi:4'-phosphopantetheinyl transferase